MIKEIILKINIFYIKIHHIENWISIQGRILIPEVPVEILFQRYSRIFKDGITNGSNIIEFVK